MSNILEFKKPATKKTHRNILCVEGHHKWVVFQEKQFDSRAGKLVTIMQCTRCKKQKTRLL